MAEGVVVSTVGRVQVAVRLGLLWFADDDDDGGGGGSGGVVERASTTTTLRSILDQTYEGMLSSSSPAIIRMGKTWAEAKNEVRPNGDSRP